MDRKDDDAGEPEAGDDTRFDPSSFVGLLIGLATQAQILLGAIDNPITRKKEEVDLDRAKNVIDLVAMLEEKTQGNLTQEEGAFLQRILADLRMRWVGARGSG
jgi:hypothetical protein